MGQIKLTISEKQYQMMQFLDDPQVVEVLFGSGAGSGKSVGVCIWMMMQIRQYPKVRIGLGRKELKRLKETTLVTLLNVVHPMFNITQNEFIYRDQKGIIEYLNGSSIVLVDLTRKPSDPEYERFGSLDLTHVVVEEAGELEERSVATISSRGNRYMNKEYKIVGKTVLTCNPSENYLKNKYYRRYEELGGGDFQKWEDGKVTINNRKLPAYKAFVRATVYDNLYIDDNYIHNLERLPTAQRKRLLEGNWNFNDSDSILFKSSLLDSSYIKEYNAGSKYIGVDLADSGKDRSVISLIDNNVLVDQVELRIDKTGNIGEQNANEIVKFAQMRGVAPDHVAIDVVGIGASTRDMLKQRGWNVKEYVAGAKSSSNEFKNLRAETVYRMWQALSDGEFKIYSSMPNLQELRNELMAFETIISEKVISITKKADLKVALGRSPDYADSAFIAYWASNSPVDPRHDTRRIIY